MAISKLDFARGQVVNPLDSIGDDLLKFGSSLHQQEKDRLAAERQNEMLNMQKQEHQMKLEEQARQLAETDNYKKFSAGLQAPSQMSEASALYNQNNNPVFKKQMAAMAFSPEEQVAYDNAFKAAGGDDKKILEHLGKTQEPLLQSTLAKTRQQQDIGEFGSKMSSMPEFKETEYQKGKRILAQMGDSAPLAGIKQLREMEAAQIASDAAKSKDLTETVKYAQDNLLKLQIEAAKHGTGDTITTTNGTVLPIDGGKGKAYNPFSFGVKQTEDKVKNYEEGIKALTSRMDALGAGKAEDVKTGQRVMAMDALNKYAAEGYDPADLASIITTKFQKEPSFYEVWKDKQTGIVLTPEELKPLEAKRTATATLDNMKLQEAQFASVLAQARNGGATGAEILKAYGPIYQNQIAKAEADKALLALTPEQRQAQATMSYLGKMMAPKADAADTVASRENATTFYKDGKVSYNKPRGYDDKPPTDNYGVKDITVKAVDGVKRLIDEKDRTSPYADLFAVSALYESDGNSKATYKEKNGNIAEGLLQWSHPARKEALLKYVNGLTDTQYKSVSDVPANLQYKYFEHDITNGQYKHVGKALASAKTDAEKMQIITDMYEQPAYGAHQAKVRSEGMASYVGSTPKAIEKANREQFNLLLNKENRTAEDTAKLDSLSKILNVGLPKDDEWKPAFEDYTAKERGNEVNIRQLFANASSAPDAPVFKVLPPKSAEQERIDNSWSGQLTNVLLGGGGGHTTWNNLGKVADQIGYNAALLGTAAVGGANRVGEFFTQPALDAYNASTGRSIGNPFAHAAVLAEAEHRRLLGKNSAVPTEKIEQAMVVQQLLGPAAATRLGAIPAVMAEKMPYASAIGSRVLGNVAEGAQYLGSKTPILGRFVKSPVLPSPKAIKNTTEVLKHSVVPVGTSTLVSGGNKLAILADEAAKIARSPITETSKMELQILLDRIPRMANGKYGDTEQAIVDGIVHLLSK